MQKGILLMFTADTRWLCAPEFAEAKPVNVFMREREGKIVLPDDRPKDVHMYARRAFIADGTWRNVFVKVTADDYYKLYINGKLVAQGPAPGYPQAYYVNDIEVSRYLRPGENVLALHVYYQGLINRVWVSGDMRQGFICELWADGQPVMVSDTAFRCTVPKSRKTGSIIGYETQFNEIIDAREEPWGWEEPGFDDSGWTVPCVKPDADYVFVSQPSAQLATEPVKAHFCGSVTGSTVYDLGAEKAGVLLLTAKGPAGAKIRVRQGEEFDQEGHVRFPSRANCPYEDEFIMDGSEHRFETYDYKGFRYLEVFADDGAEVCDITVRAQHYPAVSERCVLECGNKALRSVFELCKYTLINAVQEGFLDCPSREKGQYSGDLAVTSLGHLYVSGDARLLKKALDDWMRSGFIAPALMAVFPSALMQEIADYSFLFPMVALRYYDHSGDREFLSRCAVHAERIIETYRKYENPDGLLQNVDEAWNLVDWPKNLRDDYDFSPDKPMQRGMHNVINALYIGAVKGYEQICDILAEPCVKRADSLVRAFDAAFYNSETGLYTDTPDSAHSAVHSNIFPLFFGFTNGTKTAHIADWLIKSGMRCGVYMAFFLLKALSKAGHWEAVCDFILDDGEHSWLNMLREGATTLYEAWGKTQKWNTSLCHPWACAPLPVLIEDLCGITPALLRGAVWTPHLPVQIGDVRLTVPLCGNSVMYVREREVEHLFLNGKMWLQASK